MKPKPSNMWSARSFIKLSWVDIKNLIKNIFYRNKIHHWYFFLSLFFKGFISISKQLINSASDLEPLPKELESAGEGFHYIPPKSSQYYQVVSPIQKENINFSSNYFWVFPNFIFFQIPPNSDPNDLVGKPIVHASAMKQAAGEAIYMDDIPKRSDELYLSFVLSNRAHAKILKVDPTQALAMKGVIAFYDSNDVPEDNRMVGPIFHDEELFVSKKVRS